MAKRIDKLYIDEYKLHLKTIREGNPIPADDTPQKQKRRISRAKNDFKYFVHYYFQHYIKSDDDRIIQTPYFHVELANMVKNNPAIKVFVMWGRGLAKSTVVDIFLPLWLWINNEIKYMVLIGNNYDKAQRLLADLQAEFEANPRLIHDFGEQVTYGSWEKGFFITRNDFVAKAVGMGQDVRGFRYKRFRPDYIVADDLEDKDTIKNPRIQEDIAQWILRSVIPTMDGARRRFLMANNRFAPKMIMTILQEYRPNWIVHRIDAYDPKTYEPVWKEKYSADYYRYIEQEIGRLPALAEYNNTPHIEGKIFKYEQIQWLDIYPPLEQFKFIVGHWDVAYSGNYDYNAVRVWGILDDKFYYIASFVRQSKMADAVQWMCDFQKNLPDNVTVHWQYESQFWNDAVKQVIQQVEKKTISSCISDKFPLPEKRNTTESCVCKHIFSKEKFFIPKAKSETAIHKKDCVSSLLLSQDIILMMMHLMLMSKLLLHWKTIYLINIFIVLAKHGKIKNVYTDDFLN